MAPQPEPPSKPRLKLRLPTPNEVMEMAETGSRIDEAGEPWIDMSRELTGEKQ
jgi:hypothetical protein